MPNLTISFLKCWLSVLILFWGSLATAQQQNYQFRHLNVNKGLNHTDATCIGQDKNGFIWIGTFQGLNRYDGYEIKSFINQSLPYTSVYGNRIKDLFIDESNRIWLATQRGIDCFDLASERFINWDLDKSVDYDFHTHNPFFIHFEQETRHLFIANAKGLFVFQPQDSYLNLVKFWETATVGHISKIINRTKGEQWIYGTKGFFTINTSLQKIQLTPITIPSSISPNYLKEAKFQIKGNILWTCNKKGISKMNISPTPNNHLSGIQTFPYQLPLDPLQDITSSILNTQISDFEIHQGKIWISTTIGLFQGYFEGEKIRGKITSKAIPLNKYAPSENNINSLFLDNNNGLWIGTYGGGANYINLKQKSFSLIPKDIQQTNIPYTEFVRSILEDKHGNLWIGTIDNGIRKYNYETQEIELYNKSSVPEKKIDDNKIRSLLEDQMGRIWVGTGVGVNIIEEKYISTISFMDSLTNNDFISSIAEDKFGQIWLGSWRNGINRVNYEKEGNHQIEQVGQLSPHYQLSSDKVTFIYTDSLYPEVLVGTDNGLDHIFLNEDGTISNVRHYRATENNPNSLGSNYIWPIIRTDKNNFWVGTIGGGLNKLELTPNQKYPYKADIFSIKEGASSIDIESMLMDDNGNLWLGTKGLAYFDTDKERFTIFDVRDGLQSNSFKVGSASKGKKGRMYFGGINGANYFDPSQILQKDSTNHSIVLTELVVNNEIVTIGDKKYDWQLLEENITQTSTLKLSHLENNFSLFFSSLNFANPNKAKFKYQLEGFDKDWIHTDATNRKATYSNLDYGRYIFKVGIVSDSKIKEEKFARLTIDIIAPWWWTSLAKVIYLLILLLVMISLFQYFIRWYKLKQAYENRLIQEKQKEDLHKMRLEFFTNVSHEFKTPLTLINAPLEQLVTGVTGKRKRQRYYQIMQTNINRLEHLLEELLDFRKAETGAYKLKVSSRCFNSYLEGFYIHLKEHATLKDIEFEFKPSSSEERIWFDEKVLEKILLNLLGNAFKYTKAGGLVELNILSDVNRFQAPFTPCYKIDTPYTTSNGIGIVIKDTGKGIPLRSLPLVFDRFFKTDLTDEKGQQGTGIGLALVKSLVLISKAQLSIYSEEGKGTCFLITLPRGDNHFSPTEIKEATPKDKIQYKVPILPMELELTNGQSIGNYPKVLFVEDNLSLRQFIVEQFSEKYHLLTASNGREGIQLVQTETPDFIISDVRMPVMDGIDFCRAIKNDLATSHIPLLLLSTRTSLESKVKGLEVGADFYLPKPFSIKELDLIIENALYSREKLRNLLSKNSFVEAKSLAITTKEKAFVKELVTLIEKNLDYNEFGVKDICKAMGMGTTSLYNKVKSVFGKSTSDLIRSIRLQKAAQILASEEISFKEVMFRVGIKSQSYFTTAFKKEYGKTPSQFVADLKSPKQYS